MDKQKDTLTELRRLHEAATPALWRTNWIDATEKQPESYVVQDYATGDIVAITNRLKEGWDRSNLIVAMRNALPALLDCVEALEKAEVYIAKRVFNPPRGEVGRAVILPLIHAALDKLKGV